MSAHLVHKHPTLKEIEDKLTQSVNICYQCGKCSAGCPVREFADMGPNKVVRFVQLGMYEEALKSKMIWLCASCITCTTRCPKNFEIAGIMDVLRQMALKRGYTTDKKVYKFHKSFNKMIKKHGRSYELGLMIDYKLSGVNFFQDVENAPAFFLKRKIEIMPHKPKNPEVFKRIFKKVEKHLAQKNEDENINHQ
jgi:heterodisulfide reductase subunit C2